MAGKSDSVQGVDPRLLRQGLELNDTYRIDTFIGTGGMAEVYKGHNIQTGEPVAIKIVLPEFASDPLITELFRKEARILHHLFHDAIVRYYGFSFDSGIGRPYLATEFIEGPSLAVRMKLQPLSFKEYDVLRYRLADGLQKAHDLGIIHRDLSPENVILPSGRMELAKIIDFGIAKSADIGGRTLVGSNFAGKHNYVSPEQLGLYQGEVTAKSDVYSLGLTLAAALTGTPLNMTGSLADLIEKRQTLPDLSELPSEIHPLLTEMLQPDPAKRLPTMSAVRDWRGAGEHVQAASVQTIISNKPPDRHAAPVREPVRRQSALPNRQVSPATGGSRLVLMALAAFIAVSAAGIAAWSYLQAPTETAISAGGADVGLTNPSLTPEDFTRDFGAGECFVAVRNGQASGDPITAFSNTAEAAGNFTREFTQKFGQSPDVLPVLLTDEQCPVLKLLRQVRSANAGKPWLRLLSITLPSTGITADSTLSGSIGGLRQSSRYLLLVDAEGSIWNVSNRLSISDSGLNFSLTQPEGKTWVHGSNLLIALSTSVPSAPLERSLQRVAVADFESLLLGLVAPDAAAAVDMKTFVIE